MSAVTCEACGKVEEFQAADDAGWSFDEVVECDACEQKRRREAFREFRRENGPGEYEAAQRAKYPGVTP